MEQADEPTTGVALDLLSSASKAGSKDCHTSEQRQQQQQQQSDSEVAYQPLELSLRTVLSQQQQPTTAAMDSNSSQSSKSVVLVSHDESAESEGKSDSVVQRRAATPGAAAPRGHWRPAEDDKLRELVRLHGPQNWNIIAEKLQGRSGKSCRLRWFNQLDPRINRRPFSDEEEERLLAAHSIHGNKWALIARLFPGRTDNAVKNHWHVVMARRLREQPRGSGGNNNSDNNNNNGSRGQFRPQELPSRRGVKRSYSSGQTVAQSLAAWIHKYSVISEGPPQQLYQASTRYLEPSTSKQQAFYHTATSNQAIKDEFENVYLSLQPSAKDSKQNLPATGRLPVLAGFDEPGIIQTGSYSTGVTSPFVNSLHSQHILVDETNRRRVSGALSQHHHKYNTYEQAVEPQRTCGMAFYDFLGVGA